MNISVKIITTTETEMQTGQGKTTKLTLECDGQSAIAYYREPSTKANAVAQAKKELAQRLGIDKLE